MNRHWFLISLMRMADGQVFNSYIQATGYSDALEAVIRKTDPNITGATRDAFSVLLAVEVSGARDIHRRDNELTAVTLNAGGKWV